MPDTKITALTAIGANPIIPATFPIPMVDLTDTSMAASGTTKKVTVNQILGAGGTATLASATISGDLTVDTNVLKVDTTLNRVGIGTTSPDATLDVTSAGTASTYTVSAVIQDGTYPASGNPTLEFNGFIGGNGYRSGIGSIGGQQLAFYTPSTFGVAPTERYRIDSTGISTWSVGGSTAMTLNATGLGVGASPSYKLQAQTTADGICQFLARSGGTNNPNFRLSFTEATATTTLDANSGAGSPIMALATNGSPRMYIDTPGNVGIGVVPSAKLDINGNSAIRLPSAAGSVDLQFPYFGATNAKTIIRATGTADWRQTLKIQMNTAQSDSAPVDVLTFNNAGNLILSLPSVPPALTTNGQLTVNATSDTNLRFSYRGSDGVTRVANITLA